MLLVVWEFRVKADRALEFAELYGASGEWARLFARSAGFVGTSLARDARDPGRFLTLDRWRDAEALASFRAAFAEEYECLDERGAALTASERHLGDFDE